MGRVTQPLSSLFRTRRNLDTLKTGVELAKNRRVPTGRRSSEKQTCLLCAAAGRNGLALYSPEALYRELARLTENYVAVEVVLIAFFFPQIR